MNIDHEDFENSTESLVDNSVVQQERSAMNLLIARVKLLNAEQVQMLLSHCKELLTELHKKELAKVEAEIIELEKKRSLLKGDDYVISQHKHAEKKRRGKVIVNPNNPDEKYGGFGKKPEWLEEILKPANGDKDKERLIIKELQGNKF